MKTYSCGVCGNLVFFDNVTCLKCGHALGFLPATGKLAALEAAENGAWRIQTPDGQGQLHAQCANTQKHQVCNWLVAAGDPNPLCVSCRLNQIIPDLAVPGNRERWHRIEMAKRRLLYTVLQLNLPTDGAPRDQRPPLRFRLLGDVPGQPPVTTGHEHGLITVNIAEADDDERERRRVRLHEPYRTLVGHLRHEVAHYYWDRLIAASPWLARWRELFGDETRDYAGALKLYYDQGPPADWQTRHVSAYASSHPWEDWAETWAHYFHIIDTVETAESFGLMLKPEHPAAKTMATDPQLVGKYDSRFDLLLERWFPLTYALNSFNRGMGLQDLYPFALSTPAIEKLRFIHEVCHPAGFKPATAGV